MRQKPPGAWYVVVLMTRQVPLLRSALNGYFSTFPVPELGTQCMCCDEETTHRRAFDPGSDRTRAHPIDVPMCTDCDRHVPRTESGTASLVAMALFFSSVMFLLAMGWGIWEVGIPAALVFGFAVLWLLLGRRRRRRLAVEGHHTGLEINAFDGGCAVRTTNPRLAREVADRNRPIVHKVR